MVTGGWWVRGRISGEGQRQQRLKAGVAFISQSCSAARCASCGSTLKSATLNGTSRALHAAAPRAWQAVECGCYVFCFLFFLYFYIGAKLLHY